MRAQQFRCNINSDPGQLVSIESGPQGERPSEAAAKPARPWDWPRCSQLRHLAALYLCFRCPCSQSGWDPARSPELVTHPSLAKSGPRPGRGRGRKIKPQRLTT